MNHEPTRRRFLQQSAEAAAVTAAVSTLAGVHAFGAEKQEKIQIGIIGCGGIMTHHVKGLVSRREQVSIAWLCDVDPAQIERMSKHVKRCWLLSVNKSMQNQYKNEKLKQ